MVWARLDDAILDNPKILAVGPAGFALHVAAITWCARNLSDGRLPWAKASTLLDLDRLGVQVGEVVDCLVAERLWEPEPPIFVVHDYLAYNPSREEVLRRREADASRQQRRRSRSRRDTPRDSGAGHTVNPHHPVPVPESVSVSLRDTSPPSGATGAVIEVFEAWREATGRNGRTVLTPTRRRVIAQALKSHGRQTCLDAVRGWVNDPWAERPLHTDVGVLLRDAPHIEKFARLWTEGAPAASPRRGPTEKDRIAAWAAQGVTP